MSNYDKYGHDWQHKDGEVGYATCSRCGVSQGAVSSLEVCSLSPAGLQIEEYQRRLDKHSEFAERVEGELKELRDLNEEQYQFALGVVEENESLKKERDYLNKQIADMASNADRAQVMVSELEIENRRLKSELEEALTTNRAWEASVRGNNMGGPYKEES